MITGSENLIGNGGELTTESIRDYTLGAPVTKELTFLNSTGALSLFTVTGRVVVRITPICDVAVVSAAAANIRLGISSNTNAMIVDTVASLLTAELIWIAASPSSKIEALSAMREYIVSDGEDVILTLDAQVDSGVIAFYCSWFPLSADGNVVAA